ncbi:hypothetical protein SAMN06296020_101351 [Anoxynatronum buryatiense]|uniref:Uncharacterized protein n=1 Tax=Anoxynatronum buryatiense TaxID=489973 RepID=A0AA45WT50_9CLOT|nr:hypothetical protein SAMN06296020_101351 [Anoxynatronum buryatiense]
MEDTSAIGRILFTVKRRNQINHQWKHEDQTSNQKQQAAPDHQAILGVNTGNEVKNAANNKQNPPDKLAASVQVHDTIPHVMINGKMSSKRLTVKAPALRKPSLSL